MKDLFDQIEKLSRKDFDQLRQFVRKENIRRTSGQRKDAPNLNREYLYDEVQRAIRNARPTNRKFPIYAFEKEAKNNAALNNACFCLESMEDEICKLGRFSLTMNQRRTIYRIVTAKAVEQILYYKDDLLPVFVLTKIANNAAGLLDSAFPGYGTTPMGWKMLFKRKRNVQ